MNAQWIDGRTLQQGAVATAGSESGRDLIVKDFHINT